MVVGSGGRGASNECVRRRRIEAKKERACCRPCQEGEGRRVEETRDRTDEMAEETMMEAWEEREDRRRPRRTASTAPTACRGPAAVVPTATEQRAA